MDINKMSKKDFKNIPYKGGSIICRSLVIIPTQTQHDSKFRCMDFCAVDDNLEPICLLSGYSDVIQIEGIGGYGYNWYKKYKSRPDSIPVAGWSIDCLNGSGYLRIFCDKQIKCNIPLSSFEIYMIDKNGDNNE